KILTKDVDIVIGKRAIYLGKHTRNILVNMQDAVRPFLVRQRKRRDRMAADGHARLQVLKELVADVFADILLCLLRGPADMRRENHIGQALQRRGKLVAVFLWLPGIYV